MNSIVQIRINNQLAYSKSDSFNSNRNKYSKKMIKSKKNIESIDNLHNNPYENTNRRKRMQTFKNANQMIIKNMKSRQM
jgi:hypothetical protein